MAKKENRFTIDLKCEVCNEKNYSTVKNKVNTEGKIKIKKYCPRCRKSTIHNETVVKS